MKRFICCLIIFCLCAGTTLSHPIPAYCESSQAAVPDLKAPSAILMEAESGTVLYQKDEHKQRPPASITKIMTLDLIFEALDNQQISLLDEVTVSEHAASMGGSQVYLEPGETQTVDTMLKCISISSANDACVAMAEYIAGSEEQFVEQMNQKARQLGMEDTHFQNSCGLDTDGHLTSAYDIALMSRDLIINHPQIHDYCTIWMDTIIHHTRKGDTEFGLANTNKLLRQYPYATGLKTGSTGLAKYCLSATAKKDDLVLIAVVLASPDPKARFSDARNLLDYGFANCQIYKDEQPPVLPKIPVTHGSVSEVPLSYEGSFLYVSTNGSNLDRIRQRLSLPEAVEAPVRKGETAGVLSYYLDGEKIGSIPIRYAKSVARATFFDYYQKLLRQFFSST